LKELVKNFSEKGKVEFEWMNDPHYGHGVYIHPDKSRYDGQFKGGSFNGKGIFKWPDGGEYNGEWKNGLPNGQGIMTLPNGSRYEGEVVYRCHNILLLNCLDIQEPLSLYFIHSQESAYKLNYIN